MHGLVLDDDEADGHVARHPGQEDEHVDQGQRDEQRQPDVLGAQNLEGDKWIIY